MVLVGLTEYSEGRCAVCPICCERVEMFGSYVSGRAFGHRHAEGWAIATRSVMPSSHHGSIKRDQDRVRALVGYSSKEHWEPMIRVGLHPEVELSDLETCMRKTYGTKT